MKKLNYIKQISKTLTNHFYQQPKVLPKKVVSITELGSELEYAFARSRDKEVQTYEWVEREFDWELLNKNSIPLLSNNDWEKIDKRVEVPQYIARMQDNQYQTKIVQMARTSNSWFSFKK